MLHSGETDADWPAESGELRFFSGLEALSQAPAWERYLRAVPRKWVVYAKRPFGGPQQVLDYLGRYTHRVAISNNRLLRMEDGKVSFRWKDYRDHSRQKVMTLAVDEFIRRFLLHVLPKGFQRIRQYGLLSNLQLMAHALGGRPGERLMKRLGFAVSDDTLLRRIKRLATSH